MRPSQTLSITLNADMADMVRAKVASGEYASESEVIEDGLMSLMPEDAAIDTWLEEEVMPTLKAIDDGTVKTRPLEETRQRLHARIDRLVEGGR